VGYTCDGAGVCRAGAGTGLALDVKAYLVSGAVTLNGVNPVSDSTACSETSSGTTSPRGEFAFVEPTLFYSFDTALQGCANTPATFSTWLYPGTYRVSVEGDNSDLPHQNYAADTGLVVSAPISNLAYDVKTYTVSGAVTLNGANPVSNSSSCSATEDARGSVALTETTYGYAFSAPLQGCTNTPATFSLAVYPGTYQVSVVGNDSNLPGAPGGGYIADAGLVVNGAVSNLAYDLKAYTVSGAVTLNGANPVGTSSCATVGNPRGIITLTDAKHGAVVGTSLVDCTNTAATFSMPVYAGTYKVTIGGIASDLPSAPYLADSGLVVNATVGNLAYDVKTYAVSGAVTLNGANPVSNSTSCSTASAGNPAPRGLVALKETTQGYTFQTNLQGCANTAATFAAAVYPGTYKVYVGSLNSNLPVAAYVADGGLVVSAAVGNLAYDVKTYNVAGAVTLNGANPVSNSGSCSVTATDTANARGAVTLADKAHGYTFTTNLQGCASTAATFSTTVFPGTYVLTVKGAASDLPGASYLANGGLAINAGVTGLAYDVKASPISGAVTLNGANPVSSDDTFCAMMSTQPGYARGVVTLVDATQGYAFTAYLQGCAATTATFSTPIYPGTYKITVQGLLSNLPGAPYLAVSRVALP
jgi:hypothetical protein